jgi:protoheme IX farnesyltransferase
MKPHAVAYPPASTASSRSWLGDMTALAKPRLNALVVATTAGGYCMASPASIDFTLLALTCAGTALVAGGASAANQVYERDTDRLMARTRNRPMADGRLGMAEALAFSALLTVAGLSLLWAVATAEAMWVALATFVSYVVIYTPLKRVTSFSTVVGAVPGALPPLIGWAAATGNVAGIAPWSLFFIMFFWQLPHFLALAWMYREDYARAGMPMLSVGDPHGAATGRQALLWAAALVPFGMLPFLLGMTSAVYAIGALVMGLGLFGLAAAFARHRSIANARALFFGSIIYLPLLWLLMVATRA